MSILKLLFISLFLLTLIFTYSTGFCITVIADKNSTHKVCQLLGDQDKDCSEPTMNQTYTRHILYGTDLGASFASSSKVYFLFGDAWIYNPSMGADPFEYRNDDPIAYANASDLTALSNSLYLNNNKCLNDKCINLTIEEYMTGCMLYRPLTILNNTVSNMAYEVPTGGFNFDGVDYVFYTTDHIGGDDGTCTRSVLLKRNVGDTTFTYLYDVSRYDSSDPYAPGFIEVVPWVVNCSDYPDLPNCTSKGLLLFGTGYYRESEVYLGYIPLNDGSDSGSTPEFLETASTGNGRYVPKELYYLENLDSSAKPVWKKTWKTNSSGIWTENSKNSMPIVALNYNPDISEHSVVFDSNTSQWYMTYVTKGADDINLYNPEWGIHFRTAAKNTPWTWSDAQQIYCPTYYSASDYTGYTEFIHLTQNPWVAWPFNYLYDGLEDEAHYYITGGIYAPFMIPQMFKKHTDNKKEDIYFLLSTSNPYTTVLMKSTVKLQ